MRYETGIRNLIYSLSDRLEFGAKKLRGAANRLVSRSSLTLLACERKGWANVRPGFVLSTGRAGTLLLNQLLRLAPNAYPVHQPQPELIRVSKRAYEEIGRSPEIFRETFKTAREELVFQAAEREKVFIETNNRITFFAPIIRDIFPNAVFIHLVRHPGDFVRSGIRRNWYSGEHDHDLGRIVPLLPEMAKKWQQFSLIQKIGWLWNETNRFIEEAKANWPDDSCLFVKAEDLFTNPEVTRTIFFFLQLKGFPLKKVKRMIKRRVNAQKKGYFPPFQEWDAEERTQLREVVPLVEKYGYEL